MNDVEKLDQILEEVDNFYRSGDREGLNNRLKTLDLNSLSSAEMITYLTVTVCAANYIPYRTEFYKNVENELKRRGNYREGMLSGLEGTAENQRRSLEAVHTLNCAIASGRIRSTSIE